MLQHVRKRKWEKKTISKLMERVKIYNDNSKSIPNCSLCFVKNEAKEQEAKIKRKYIRRKEPLSDVYFLLWERHRRIELIYQSKLGKFLILQMTFVVAPYFRFDFDCFYFIILLSFFRLCVTTCILVQLNWKRVSSQIILYMFVTSYSMLLLGFGLLFLRFYSTNWDHFSCLFIFHYFLSLVYSIPFCWKIMYTI